MYKRLYKKLVSLMFPLFVVPFQFPLFTCFFQTSYFMSVCLCLSYFSPFIRLSSIYLNADRFSSLTPFFPHGATQPIVGLYFAAL